MNARTILPQGLLVVALVATVAAVHAPAAHGQEEEARFGAWQKVEGAAETRAFKETMRNGGAFDAAARTYLEHGNSPYLSRAFFEHMQHHMPHNWVLFVAERDGRPIASSLVAIQGLGTPNAVAYGRYWGALERVDCLHFEACYYQPLSWCIANGVQRFEGGAQGEHKMARALMPVATYSAHWLAHPAFADAVERFLERESAGVDNYLDHLAERSPFKRQEPQ
jgi:predicted N-acyltransferase